MALPQIDLFLGSPIADPFDVLFGVLYEGNATASANKIVVDTIEGYKVVFKGSFTIVGGDVTGGTMTGYTVFAGSTKMMKGSGYAVDGAELFDTIEGYNVDSGPFDNLVIDIPIKIVGSDKSDFYQGIAAGSKIYTEYAAPKQYVLLFPGAEVRPSQHF